MASLTKEQTNAVVKKVLDSSKSVGLIYRKDVDSNSQTTAASGHQSIQWDATTVASGPPDTNGLVTMIVHPSGRIDMVAPEEMPTLQESLRAKNYVDNVNKMEYKSFEKRDSIFENMDVHVIGIAGNQVGPALPMQAISVSQEPNISANEYTNRAVSMNKGITSLSTPLNAFSLSRTTLNTAYNYRSV